MVDGNKFDHPDRPETTEGHHGDHNTATLDQISAEKTKITERLVRLDADRAKIATELTDLETAERVLTRVSKTPPAKPNFALF